MIFKMFYLQTSLILDSNYGSLYENILIITMSFHYCLIIILMSKLQRNNVIAFYQLTAYVMGLMNMI